MSGEAKCPACILKAGIHRVGQWPGTLTTVDKTCTGRPGCVRADHVADAGEMVPAGGAGIVGRLRGGTVAAAKRWPGDTSPPVDESETDALMTEAADEIARLRAEVERVTADLSTERHERTRDAVRMMQHQARADRAIADRAALAQRVAEAVRDHLDDTVHDAIHDAIGDVSERDRVRSDVLGAMRAADLGPIVAAALTKEGE